MNFRPRGTLSLPFCSGKQCEQNPDRVISQLPIKSTGKNLLGETSAFVCRKGGFI